MPSCKSPICSSFYLTLLANAQNSQPFIDLGTDIAKKPGVLKKFSVTSSEPLNCSKLNELRKLGVLKGEYSCQGQTVADESRAGRDFGLGIGLGLTIAVILWGL